MSDQFQHSIDKIPEKLRRKIFCTS